jgi:multiple sugar transport system permease protein
MTTTVNTKIKVSDKSPDKKAFSFGKLATNFTLVFIAAVLLVPALWMTIAPSKDRAQLVSFSPLKFGSFGSYLTRWRNLMQYDNEVLIRWIENSFWYTLGIVLLSTTMSLLGGFALAATNIKFKRQILMLVMIAMIIPGIALVMPMFIWVNKLGLTDTELGLILASSLYPFGVFLSYIHFSTVIPKELYEAAKIDGCGYFKIFWKVALPISKSLAGIVAFFSFVGAWNNFFLPQVFILSGEKHPLSSGLTLLFTNTPAFSGNSSAILPIERSEIALSAMVITLPIILLFLFSQRFLSRGMLAGSVKS